MSRNADQSAPFALRLNLLVNPRAKNGPPGNGRGDGAAGGRQPQSRQAVPQASAASSKGQNPHPQSQRAGGGGGGGGQHPRHQQSPGSAAKSGSQQQQTGGASGQQRPSRQADGGDRQRQGGNWTVSSNGVPPVHPEHARNLFQLGRLIERVRPISLRPVERDLYVVNDPAAAKSIPKDILYRRDGVQLTDPVEIVWHWGDLFKRTFGTLTADPVFRGKAAPYPDGLAIFRPSEEGAEGNLERVAKHLSALFAREQACPTLGFSGSFTPPSSGGKVLLGYSKRKLPEGKLGYSNTFADNVAFLRDDLLSEYLVGVAKGIADSLGIAYGRIPDWTVLIAGYNTRANVTFSAKDNGFNFHTDGCRDFGDYPGVVANMTICLPRADGKESTKYFDLVDILDSQTVVRLELKTGDIAILSGEPRVSYGHGVPNVPKEQTHFTLAFKFPYEKLGAPYTQVLEKPSLPWAREVYVVKMYDALRELDRARESSPSHPRLDPSAAAFVPA